MLDSGFIHRLTNSIARRGLTSLAPTLAQVLAPAEYVVAQLRQAGAESPGTATRFHAPTAAVERAFLNLQNEGVVRRASPGRYYLDERTLARVRPWDALPKD